MKKRILLIVLTVFALLLLVCCSGETSGIQSVNTTTKKVKSATIESMTVSTNDGGMEISGNLVTILDYGTYTLSGTASNGRVIINTGKEGNVTLILNNVDLTCRNDAPIFVENAKLVTIKTEGGTTNKLADSGPYISDSEATATIYSKDDLIFAGTGILSIEANANNGIVTKNELTFESGNIQVVAANNGIKGKDLVTITGGELNVTAQKDGIKSNEDNDPEYGYVKISGGKITVSADDDGIQANTAVIITAGEISIKAADDGISGGDSITVENGTIIIDTDNNGMKAEKSINIAGGNIEIKTADDDFVCSKLTGTDNANITVNGKKITLK